MTWIGVLSKPLRDICALKKAKSASFTVKWAQSALPHKKLAGDMSWQVHTDHVSLVVQPGLRPCLTGEAVSVGVPYGSRARLIILYLQSEKVRELYRNPELLWLLSPVFLYWASRIWLLSFRGQIHEDPVIFVLKDRVTYAVAAIAGIIMIVAA